MSKHIALVDAGDLTEMIREAFDDNDIQIAPDTIVIEDYTLVGEDKRLVKGLAKYRAVTHREPLLYSEARSVEFDVNVGTHKDVALVFDPLEVVLYAEGGKNE